MSFVCRIFEDKQCFYFLIFLPQKAGVTCWQTSAICFLEPKKVRIIDSIRWHTLGWVLCSIPPSSILVIGPLMGSTMDHHPWFDKTNLIIQWTMKWNFEWINSQCILALKQELELLFSLWWKYETIWHISKRSLKETLTHQWWPFQTLNWNKKGMYSVMQLGAWSL